MDGGRYYPAYSAMRAAMNKAEMAPVAGLVANAGAAAYEMYTRCTAMVAAATALAGTPVTLQTTKGAKKGTLVSASTTGITLAEGPPPAKGAADERPKVSVPWPSLSAEGEKQLAAKWTPSAEDNGAIGMALVELSRGDAAAAEKWLAKGRSHSLASHVKMRIEAVKRGDSRTGALPLPPPPAAEVEAPKPE
jgi:hypothetical protein